MLLPLLLAASTTLPSPACVAPGRAAPSATVADTTLAALFASGITFETFLAAADDRKAQWDAHWSAAVVPADVLATAQALTGKWRLLVVTVDSCSDSVNTIPYLAKLVALVPAIELRIVDPGTGRAVMEAHRTPDGRAATPTVVILAPDGREAGCWVERPSVLQGLAVKAREEGKLDAFARDKQQWYDADVGASTVREVVAALSAAEAGLARCDAPR